MVTRDVPHGRIVEHGRHADVPPVPVVLVSLVLLVLLLLVLLLILVVVVVATASAATPKAASKFRHASLQVGPARAVGADT